MPGAVKLEKSITGKTGLVISIITKNIIQVIILTIIPGFTKIINRLLAWVTIV